MDHSSKKVAPAEEDEEDEPQDVTVEIAPGGSEEQQSEPECLEDATPGETAEAPDVSTETPAVATMPRRSDRTKAKLPARFEGYKM